MSGEEFARMIHGEDAASIASTFAFLRRHPSLLSGISAAASRSSGWPEELEEYTVIARVGGGLSEVFEAVGPDGAKCAVKVSIAGDALSATSVEKEARLLCELQGGPVLVPLSQGEAGSRTWFATRWLTGPDFSALLDGAPCETVESGLRCMLEVAESLAFCHERGVVHRDVKPANLRLDGERVVLIDFGLAVEGATIPGLRELAGTIPYMSPEQTLGGLAAVEAASDVYSLAVVFYEWFAGVAVAELDGRKSVLESVAFSTVPSLSRFRRVPKEVDRVFERALAKDPAARYRDASELVADLVALREGESMKYVREAPSRYLRRFVRRHPLAVCLAAVATLVLTGTLGIEWLADVRERGAAIAELTSSLAAGDYGRVARIVDRRHALLVRDDRYATLLMRHADRIGRAWTHTVLRDTGFTIQGEIDEHVLEAMRRARWLFELTRAPDFLLQDAWLSLHWRGAASARARLHAQSQAVTADSRLLELSLIVANELGERGLSEELASRVARVGDSELSVQERSFRAYRRIRRVTAVAAKPGWRVTGTEREESLREAREDLDYVVSKDPGSSLANVGLVLIGFARSDFVLAEKHLRRLRSIAAGVAADSVHVLFGRLVVATDGERGAEFWHDFEAVASRRPGVRWWVVRQLPTAFYNSRFVDLIAEIDPNRIPATDRLTLLQIALNTIATALMRGDAAAVETLGSWARSMPYERFSLDETYLWEDMLCVRSWLGVHAGERCLEANQAEKGREWFADAIRTTTACLKLGLPRPYQIRAAHALALEGQLRCGVGRRETVRAAINALLSKTVVDAALSLSADEDYQTGVRSAHEALSKAAKQL